MNRISRRKFLVQSGWLGAAAITSAWTMRDALAKPAGTPIGIQLYTVGEPMRKDAAGTLKTLRKIGFREVESAGFGTYSAKQFRKLLDDADLTCPSAHLNFDLGDPGPVFEDAHAIGARYATSSMLHALMAGSTPAGKNEKLAMSLDEAKRTAEFVNRLGEKAKRADLQYVYHNHAFEFVDQGDGVTGYDVLLRETDPNLVQFEIDCGWMVSAGRNPIDYFKAHPGRFPLIHVKDFLPKTGADADEKMRGAELGHGVIDYKPILAAAKQAGLRHYFAEQEGPFERMSQLEAAKVAYGYLRSIS